MGTAPDRDYGIDDFGVPSLPELIGEGAGYGYWIALVLALIVFAAVRS